ncbi:Aste57867_8146 [Aphanomyces stellatus]|uniref:Aste57867_8146 protein n=1 Tax=Aphanomyces stellatus TaxID=120398 RepID=A0A485KJH8_9STRA|nr:hypothetical protein As57867_008116 [Aphanomyces stellatus]VFT85035.1 Aste57867_8146 [Aphanomyces stellatus]
MVFRVDWMFVLGLLTLVTNIGYFVRIVYLMELTQELNSFHHLHSEYMAPDVVDAFGVIESFLDTQVPKDKTVACAYTDLLRDRSAARPLELARERIVHWYERVSYYHKHGLLEAHAFDDFPGPFRAARFVAELEPLTLASCKHSHVPNCHLLFDYIRGMYDLNPRDSAASTCAPIVTVASKKQRKADDNNDGKANEEL